MIYKIIEKPVHADTFSTPSAGQISYYEKPATPDVPYRAHGNGNQTLAATSKYRERGRGLGSVDQRGRGYGGDRGQLRDEDPSKWTTTHGARIEGTRQKHYNDAADHVPHRNVDMYKYGSHANGAAMQQLQHHVHGPHHLNHGQLVNDVWHGKLAGKDVNHIGDGHKHGHSVEVIHGHFGDVLRVASDQEHGGMHLSKHKPMHLGHHRHVHFGDYQHVYSGDPKNSGHLGRHNFEHFGGHRFKHFGGVGHGIFGGAWRTQDTSNSGGRGQNQRDRPTGSPGAHQHIDNLNRNVTNFSNTNTARDQYGHSLADADLPGPKAAYRELDERGFPRLHHDHKFINPVYGHHSMGGYQVQENVADLEGMIPFAVPQTYPATTAPQVFQIDHNYPSPASGIGSGDTLDGMSSVSAIASPPTVDNVYYTLDPVVPYNDVSFQPQRETI